MALEKTGVQMVAEGADSFLRALEQGNKGHAAFAAASEASAKATAAFSTAMGQVKIDQLTGKIANQEKELGILNQELAATAARYGEGSVQAQRKQLAIDKLTNSLHANEGTLNATKSAASTFTQELEKGGQGASAFSKVLDGALLKVGSMVAEGFAKAGSTVVGFFKDSIGAAGTFESALLKFSSISGKALTEGGNSLKGFSDLFLKMGADTQYSAQQAAQAAIELAKGGMAPATIAADGLASTLALASAGDLDLAKAATIAAKETAIWAETGVRAKDVANLMAQAANASTVNVDDLALGMANVGSIAKTAGLSFKETTTAMALLAPGFSSAADAGTSFKTFLIALTPTTKPAIKAMKDLGLVTEDGKSKFYDAQGSFIGMAQASDLLKNATKNLTQEEKKKQLALAFGTDAFRAAAGLADAGADGYDKMAKSMDGLGSATDQAAAKQKGWDHAVEAFHGSLETLQIVLGGKVLPIFTSFVETLTETVNGLIAMVDWVGKVGDAIPNLGFSLKDVIDVLPGFSQAAFAKQQLADLKKEASAGTPIIANLGTTMGNVGAGLQGISFKLHNAALASGALGAAGKLTASDMEGLQKALEKIEKDGTTALSKAMNLDVSFLETREQRQQEHNDKIAKLNQAYREADTQSQKNHIADQIATEMTGYAQKQQQDDLAYARERAAAQKHLGEMLIDYVDNQVQMGAITAEKGNELNAQIAAQYGVAADSTVLLFGKMTQSINDWATSGTESAAAFTGGLLKTQDGAVATQQKLDSLSEEMVNNLEQQYRDGKLTVEQFTKALLEVPAKVHSVLEIREQYIKDMDASNAEAGRQHGAPIPARAEGGFTAQGQLYKVGERGWEYFIPWTDGQVVSHADSMQLNKRIAPPASPAQIATSYNTTTSYAPQYNYAPTYGSAPRAPSQDFAMMRALAGAGG